MRWTACPALRGFLCGEVRAYEKIMMIGCGAMGGAILSGCLSKGLWTKEEVYIKASTEKSTVEKAERYGVSAASLKDIGEADFVLWQ